MPIELTYRDELDLLLLCCKVLDLHTNIWGLFRMALFISRFNSRFFRQVGTAVATFIIVSAYIVGATLIIVLLARGGSLWLIGALLLLGIIFVLVGSVLYILGRLPHLTRRLMPRAVQQLLLGPLKITTELWFSTRYGLRKSGIYTSMKSEKKQIRLLSISPGRPSDPIVTTLKCVELGANTPAYTALSYIWGSDLFLRHISLNHSPYTVTSNLFHALKYLRCKDAERSVWIDALCIDQNNLEERRQQVGLMRFIYSQADNVIIWLGDATSTTDCAMRFLGKAQSDVHPRSWFDERLKFSFQRDQLEWKAVLSLFNKEYWRRVWIIQETAVAKHLSVACGQYELSWDCIVEAQTAWTSFLAAAREKTTKRVIEFVEGFTLLEDTLSLNREPKNVGPVPLAINRAENATGEETHLLQLLKDSWASLASDPKDKVYALLGLAADCQESSFQADYSLNQFQAYLRMIEHILKTHGNLDIITLSGMHILPLPQITLRVPSWVPIFYWAWEAPTAAMSSAYIFKEVSCPFTAAGPLPAVASFVPDPRFITKLLGYNRVILRAKGCRIDRISRVIFEPWALTTVAWKSIPERVVIEQGVSAARELSNVRSVQRIEAGSHISLIRRLSNFFICCPPSDEREHQRLTDILWRTLVFNRTFDGDVAPENWSDVFSVVLRGPASLPEELRHPTEPLEKQAQEFMQPYLRTYSNLITAKRTVFETTSGMIAVAQQDVKPGDHVIVVLGCNMPMVMRETQQRSLSGENAKGVLYGTTYVHEYMYGRAAEEIDSGKRIVEEFDFL